MDRSEIRIEREVGDLRFREIAQAIQGQRSGIDMQACGRFGFEQSQADGSQERGSLFGE